MSFPNAARVMVDAFETWQATLPQRLKFRSGGKTPKNLQEVVPFVRVTRAGGPTDVIQDFPITRVEVWAERLDDAEDIAEEIRVRLSEDFLWSPTYGQLDRTEAISLHQEIEDEDNPDLRRVMTTYQSSCRRLPVTG